LETPDWFASAMVTGIVANAALLLPHRFETARPSALDVWVCAATVPAVLLVRSVARRREARAHLLNLAMAPFHGAPARSAASVPARGFAPRRSRGG
jgi:hypothetical protein